MTGAQLTGDLIQRRAADITADGKKNRTVLGVEFFDGGASARRVALAEDLRWHRCHTRRVDCSGNRTRSRALGVSWSKDAGWPNDPLRHVEGAATDEDGGAADADGGERLAGGDVGLEVDQAGAAHVVALAELPAGGAGGQALT